MCLCVKNTNFLWFLYNKYLNNRSWQHGLRDSARSSCACPKNNKQCGAVYPVRNYFRVVRAFCFREQYVHVSVPCVPGSLNTHRTHGVNTQPSMKLVFWLCVFQFLCCAGVCVCAAKLPSKENKALYWWVPIDNILNRHSSSVHIFKFYACKQHNLKFSLFKQQTNFLEYIQTT